MADAIDVDIAAAQCRLAETLAGVGPPDLIDGRWRPPSGVATEEQSDPSRGETTGLLTYSSDHDLDEAVRSAAAAQPAWAATGVAERVAALRRLGDAVAAARALLVPLIALEAGKTLAEADEEIDLSCALIEVLAAIDDRWATPARGPLGVAAGIALYHYPVLSPLWMALPGLTAGNGYVLRPCTWSPVTGVVTADLVNRAGYPAGLLNVVHGSLDIVNSILRHPGLPTVSYVGSGPWAQYVVDTASPLGKRVRAHGAVRQLHIVADDAEPVTAARRVGRSSFDCAGQRWLAGSTVVVGDAIAPAFVDALCVEAAAVRVGASTDPATSMGPVIQRFRQRELVDRVGDARTSVDVLVDGSAFAEEAGFFFGPTVIDDVPPGHRLLVEQVAGPIVSVVRTEPDRAASLHHRDAHDTVRMIHGGSPVDEPARPGSAWLGSMPWDSEDMIDFFTSS